MARVEDGRCLLDLRAVPEEADEELALAVRRAGVPPGTGD
jgi:L-seryl-tRNA(Ser) seleniumtransferase